MKIFWTDGSANPNPGPGGYAVIEQTDAHSAHPIIIGKEPKTTNIRMEGLALRAALKATIAANDSAKIYTDSEFWINVLTKWAQNWEKHDWTKSTGPIKNVDLVRNVYDLYQIANAELIWTESHIGTEFNELADQWANKARKGETIE